MRGHVNHRLLTNSRNIPTIQIAIKPAEITSSVIRPTPSSLQYIKLIGFTFVVFFVAVLIGLSSNQHQPTNIISSELQQSNSSYLNSNVTVVRRCRPAATLSSIGTTVVLTSSSSSSFTGGLQSSTSNNEVSSTGLYISTTSNVAQISSMNTPDSSSTNWLFISDSSTGTTSSASSSTTESSTASSSSSSSSSSSASSLSSKFSSGVPSTSSLSSSSSRSSTGLPPINTCFSGALDCTGRGNCIFNSTTSKGYCNCFKSWSGANCSLSECDTDSIDCYDRGSCKTNVTSGDGTCSCYPNYFGPVCNEVKCGANHNFCSLHSSTCSLEPDGRPIDCLCIGPPTLYKSLTLITKNSINIFGLTPASTCSNLMSCTFTLFNNINETLSQTTDSRGRQYQYDWDHDIDEEDDDDDNDHDGEYRDPDKHKFKSKHKHHQYYIRGKLSVTMSANPQVLSYPNELSLFGIEFKGLQSEFNYTLAIQCQNSLGLSQIIVRRYRTTHDNLIIRGESAASLAIDVDPFPVKSKVAVYIIVAMVIIFALIAWKYRKVCLAAVKVRWKGKSSMDTSKKYDSKKHIRKSISPQADFVSISKTDEDFHDIALSRAQTRADIDIDSDDNYVESDAAAAELKEEQHRDRIRSALENSQLDSDSLEEFIDELISEPLEPVNTSSRKMSMLGIPVPSQALLDSDAPGMKIEHNEWIETDEVILTEESLSEHHRKMTLLGLPIPSQALLDSDAASFKIEDNKWKPSNRLIAKKMSDLSRNSSGKEENNDFNHQTSSLLETCNPSYTETFQPDRIIAIDVLTSVDEEGGAKIETDTNELKQQS